MNRRPRLKTLTQVQPQGRTQTRDAAIAVYIDAGQGVVAGEATRTQISNCWNRKAGNRPPKDLLIIALVSRDFDRSRDALVLMRRR